MLRPRKEGDAVFGPFVEAGTLEAILSEMGRLAIQVGEILTLFFPAPHGKEACQSFAVAKLKWLCAAATARVAVAFAQKRS
jgi:hypothetical protein